MVLVDFRSSFKAHSSIRRQLHLSDLLQQMIHASQDKIYLITDSDATLSLEHKRDKQQVTERM